MSEDFEKQPETTFDDLTSLEDVEVETMGLVEQGAVGESFFLLKNKGEAMDPDDLDLLDENLDEVEPNTFFAKLGWQRLKGLIAKGLAAEAETAPEAGPPSTEDTEPEDVKTEKAKTKKMLTGGAARGVMALLRDYSEDLPPNVVGMLRGLLGGDHMQDGEEMKKTEQKDQEVTTMAKEEKDTQGTQPEEPAPVTKAARPGTPPEADKDLVARLEKAEKATEATLARLEKAEAELEKARTMARQERDARELVTYIEKARQFTHISAKADELGVFLHQLAKMDQVANVEKSEDAEDRSDLVGYITGLLKATNEQLVQAGFFAEAGSSRVPEEGDLISKAYAAVDKGEYASFEEALLNVKDEDAQEYLRQFDVKKN